MLWCAGLARYVMLHTGELTHLTDTELATTRNGKQE